MPKKRRKFSREFKTEAVRMVSDGGRSVAETARELSISPNLLTRWKHEFAENGDQAFPGKGRLADEVRRLHEPLLASLYSASVRGRIAIGPGTGQRVSKLGDRIDVESIAAALGPRCAAVAGVSVHANVAVPARDRERLERLARYVARPPVATERLSLLADGRVSYGLRHRWRDGTTHVAFDPLDFVGKLAALIPPPRRQPFSGKLGRSRDSLDGPVQVTEDHFSDVGEIRVSIRNAETAFIRAIRGATHEGRLRWGVGEEAFWGDYFNGSKRDNPWLVHLPQELQPKQRRGFKFFGIEIGGSDGQNAQLRPFMARFGEIARIEARGRDVHVTLKSGTTFDLDRFEASDFDDGIRVWDAGGRAIDDDSLRVRSIEFLPTPVLGDAPYRLHGTVRTRHGDFTSFIQWDREKCVGVDTLDGRTADGEWMNLRFDTLHSIARRSQDGALVTLLDGREIVLSGSADVSDDNRGIYVDDRRYGRVLVSWEAFERVDFNPAGSGPAHGEFPPGRPLTGSVTTRAGRRLEGRLIYDLDESETTETLDAPSGGVDYTIPFGLIASVLPAGGDALATVILHDGEELQLEHVGDLGERHGGMLIFVDGRERPDYVPWAEVARIDFDRDGAKSGE